MHLRLTITMLLAVYSLQAQRIIYGQPEMDYEKSASFDIIGKVGQRYLIHIAGTEGSEIAVYDDTMHKVSKRPPPFPDRFRPGKISWPIPTDSTWSANTRRTAMHTYAS
jgi:hypothetical protein